MGVAFDGQVPVFYPVDRDKGRGDFRNVPRSDSGNRCYDDKGMLGNYQTRPDQFPNPEGVVIAYDGGYAPDIERQRHGCGIEAADVVRGFCKPVLTEDPAYDKNNYQDRYSVPKHPDEDLGNADRIASDYEFRSRAVESKGFLSRPRIPKERG